MNQSYEYIDQQLDNALSVTDYDFLGKKCEGKVRDSYIAGDKRYLIATDRISCFDKVIGSIPFKGQVLCELADYWFEETKDIVENHVISYPDPNVVVCKNCEVLPVEIVVRGYLTGSAWRDYQGGRSVSGIALPAGLRQYQKFENPIITPSTKALKGEHDKPISEEEILNSNLVASEIWKQVCRISLELFARASEIVSGRGLILVDTKYEFGVYEGRLVLVDEIHTLDSSRYWLEGSYQETLVSGEAPKMLDKEPVRIWLMDQGYMGDGDSPALTDEYRKELAVHYIDSYNKISGLTFRPYFGDIDLRIKNNLLEYLEA